MENLNLLLESEKETLLISIYSGDEFSKLEDFDTLEELIDSDEWKTYYGYNLEDVICKIIENRKKVMDCQVILTDDTCVRVDIDCQVGDTVTGTYHDENGMYCKKTGIVEDILVKEYL